MRVVAGKIELTEKLAEGGMAEVFRGRNVVTGADVAVKLLAPTAAEATRERFRLEARVASRLSHRGIVRVFDLLEDADGTLALVMEFLVGETAERRFATGAVDPDDAVAMVLPILGALEHAHAVGIVHRDVKPANIFLAVEPDGKITPKLLDFGVAKASVSTVQTIDGTVLGTARYMSPEQIRGETLDGRSDLFSVAVVLYEAITGECPFAANDGAAAIARVLELVVDPHERIPAKLWLAVQRGLSKQRYERPASAGAFARELVLATGSSSDDLAARLAAAPPSPPRLDTRGEIRPVVVSATTTGARSRRPRLVLGGFALAGAVALAAAVFARAVTPHIRDTPAAPGAIMAPTPAASSVAAVPSASTSAPLPSSEDDVPAPPSSKSAPKPRTAQPPPPPPRKKEVASTPGF